MATDSYIRRANRILAAVFALFVVAVLLRHQYPHDLIARMAYVVFESALVGGIADWFAVTALFRRPLGFPWHTAIIPRNRDKMIEAIARAVQNELLGKETIKRRLAEICLVDIAIKWLGEKQRQETLRALSARYVQDGLRAIEPRIAAIYGQRLIKQVLRESTLADKITHTLQAALASGKIEQLIDYLLTELGAIARQESTRLAIKQYLEQYKESTSQSWWQKLVLDIAELTDTLNLEDAAAVLHLELVQLLEDLMAPQHPIRRWIRSRLTDALAAIQDDPVWRSSVTAWQQGVAERLDLEDALATLIGVITTNVRAGEVSLWARRQAGRLWESFRTDPVLQGWVEERLKEALGELIDLEHNLVATVVKEALGRLSDKDLNNFIEDKAGEDLAWIRINGSVVGGLTGLMLVLVLQYIYSPYIVPAIQSWLR